jgi:hypothetical protein
MKQIVKLFTDYDGRVDTKINRFLKEHPDYTIDKIAFDSKGSDRVLIVFNVKDSESLTAVGVIRSGETKIIEFEGKDSDKCLCDRCIYQSVCLIRDKYKNDCPWYKRDAPDGGYYG